MKDGDSVIIVSSSRTYLTISIDHVQRLLQRIDLVNQVACFLELVSTSPLSVQT